MSKSNIVIYINIIIYINYHNLYEFLMLCQGSRNSISRYKWWMTSLADSHFLLRMFNSIKRVSMSGINSCFVKQSRKCFPQYIFVQQPLQLRSNLLRIQKLHMKYKEHNNGLMNLKTWPRKAWGYTRHASAKDTWNTWFSWLILRSELTFAQKCAVLWNFQQDGISSKRLPVVRWNFWRAFSL